MKNGIASSSSYANSICKFETSRPASNTKVKSLGSHMRGRIYVAHLKIPTKIQWTILVGCTGNEVLGKVQGTF